MKRLLIIITAVLALAGCSTVPGGQEMAGVAASAVDALTGPDTDYKNYLTHCRAEVKAQADALEADSKALQAGLTSGNEKTQYGATLIMAFKAGQGGPRIGCTAQRKKGLAELAFEKSDLLDLGFRVYDRNRESKERQKDRETAKELSEKRMEHERDMNRQNNDLLTTLTGDKLRLQDSAQDDAYRRAQLPAD